MLQQKNDISKSSQPARFIPSTTSIANLFFNFFFKETKQVSLLLVLLLVSIFANFFIGPFPISLRDMWLLWQGQAEQITHEVFWQLRMPRLLLGLFIGMAYGLSGNLMQTLFKNSLADPSLIGVSSGASVGVICFMLFASWFTENYTTLNYFFNMPIGAFLGAMLSIFFIYRLSLVRGKISVSIMLLAGIAVNAMLGALIGIFSYVSDETTLKSFIFWTLGSLSMADYKSLLVLAPSLFLVFLWMMHKRHELNLLLLGEEEAKNSGVNTELLKKIIIVCVALVVGLSVAFTGIISFIGLVVPHVSRLLVGSHQKKLLPFSTLFGGFLILWADAIARVSIAPAELPIGILTALFGAPFFLWLLLKQKREIF